VDENVKIEKYYGIGQNCKMQHVAPSWKGMVILVKIQYVS